MAAFRDHISASHALQEQAFTAVFPVVAVAVVVELEFDQVFELGLRAVHCSLTLVHFLTSPLIRKKKPLAPAFAFFFVVQIN